jgi:glycerol-3-phosphate O-acyltransferase
MANSPWPKAEIKKVLFIIDAAHKVEQDLLINWLSETKTPSAYSGEISQSVVPIAKDPENIPINALQLALDVSPDTLIVPVRVVWLSSVDNKNTSPRLVDLLRGNPRRPTFRQARAIIQKDPARALCLAASPATLGELSERLQSLHEQTVNSETLASYVASQAGLALDIAERRLRGSRYKVPRQVANNLKASPKFKQALQQLREQLPHSDEQIAAETDDIMKELIAIPRTFWQDVLAALNRKIMSLGYEGNFVVDPDSLQRFRTLVRENPSAMLWTHKTHVDGFAVYSVLFENDFPVPHVLGGVNMAFAGLGFLARRAGAIFIRRSFQDNLLYKMILKQYIGYLLEKRFPITWAFEGTRSRVGKLMPPRYGLLKYVIEGAHATDARNLHIIPVAINYDLIGDVKSYAREQSGAVKQAESLRWFIRYLRGLKQPMGRIYIDFGEPIVLERAPSGEDKLALAKIAFQVGVEANRVTPITLASLITMTLLGAAPRALTREEMQQQLDQLTTWARQRNIRLTSDFDRENEAHTIQLTQALVNNGLITRYDAGPEVVYGIAPNQHAVAGYYRNTIIHHFVNKAIAELALLYTSSQTDESSELFWQEAERLRDLFKFEFFYAPSDQFKQEVREELNRYQPGWEQQLDQQNESALPLLVQFEPHVAHATLLPYIEAYRVVADVLARLDENQTLEAKDCVNQALNYGKQAYLQRRITSEASIGKLLFENGFTLASHQGLTDVNTANLAERRKMLSQEFRRLAHRLDRIRAISLPNPYQD